VSLRGMTGDRSADADFDVIGVRTEDQEINLRHRAILLVACREPERRSGRNGV
jgi:hypothetical protein